ncbi:hypothetical protein BHE74_00047408 [Ensete ventricosum]|nr:hypothetical protein BHE74_00047408 [Ensete ventricosum]
MANEIVPAEGPSDPPSRTSSMPSVRPPRVPQYSPSPFDSEKVPPTLVADVRRFLRVANQIESESPRVAYHCKKKPSFPPGSSWTIYISRLTRFLDRHGKKKAELRDYRKMRIFGRKAAVSAVRSVRGLPLAEAAQDAGGHKDLFERLQCWFGFQKGNVANQREHLILLLANIQGRLSPKPKSMSKVPPAG